MPNRSRAKRKPIFVLGMHMRAPDIPVHVGLHLESRVRTLSVLQSAPALSLGGFVRDACRRFAVRRVQAPAVRALTG